MACHSQAAVDDLPHLCGMRATPVWSVEHNALDAQLLCFLKDEALACGREEAGGGRGRGEQVLAKRGRGMHGKGKAGRRQGGGREAQGSAEASRAEQRCGERGRARRKKGAGLSQAPLSPSMQSAGQLTPPLAQALRRDRTAVTTASQQLKCSVTAQQRQHYVSNLSQRLIGAFRVAGRCPVTCLGAPHKKLLYLHLLYKAP